MRSKTMKRLGFFTLLIAFLAPVALQANALERSIPIAGIELFDCGVVVAGKVGSQAFDSFSAFKRAMGPAGENMQWHHLVEQNPTNVAQFGQRALQTTDNLVPLSTPLHQQISGFYSSIRPDVTSSLTQTVRQWVSAQSFEAQAQFGQSILTKVLNGIKP